MRLSRARIYWSRELLVVMLAKRPQLARYASTGARKHLEEQVADPGLRARLTPEYALGCKRVLLSNDYYPALTRDNVDLVTDPITRITADAVVTADGTETLVDTIILGTGFAATEPPIARRVHGADGRTWPSTGPGARPPTWAPPWPASPTSSSSPGPTPGWATRPWCS